MQIDVLDLRTLRDAAFEYSPKGEYSNVDLSHCFDSELRFLRF